MLKRIELTNFMSHRHTVLDLAPGLTVLVGPNNCGKSAVVAALQILCHNENSTYVLRHGEKECSIRVETDDGHVIEWRRKKTGGPYYVIDGKPYDRLSAGGMPHEELNRVLRLPMVDAGDKQNCSPLSAHVPSDRRVKPETIWVSTLRNEDAFMSAARRDSTSRRTSKSSPHSCST